MPRDKSDSPDHVPNPPANRPHEPDEQEQILLYFTAIHYGVLTLARCRVCLSLLDPNDRKEHYRYHEQEKRERQA